jgi:hypothetical protein
MERSNGAMHENSENLKLSPIRQKVAVEPGQRFNLKLRKHNIQDIVQKTLIFLSFKIHCENANVL